MCSQAGARGHQVRLPLLVHTSPILTNSISPVHISLHSSLVSCQPAYLVTRISYLHINGFIHRDLKAANLLIDDDGTVLLGDLGVAAFLWESEDTPTSSTSPPTKRLTISTSSSPSTSQSPTPTSRHHAHKPRTLGKRKSFVGTPCWMAPEVINGKQYDASADIWSFGITALELTQGRPPRSRDKPHSVLLHIVRDAPPTLDRAAGVHKYSRAFQEMIASCLNKDPSQRPTAAELLQTPFFKGAKKKSYLVNTILKGLPPLTQRQERRKHPSIIAHPTMDSWDFATTIGSPTTSVYSHSKARPKSSIPASGVFEIEDDEGVVGDTEGDERDYDEDRDGGEGRGVARPPRSIDSTKRGEEEEGESAAAYARRITGAHAQTSRSSPQPQIHARTLSWSFTSSDDGDHHTNPPDNPNMVEIAVKSSSTGGGIGVSEAPPRHGISISSDNGDGDTLIPPPSFSTLVASSSSSSSRVLPMSKVSSSSSSTSGAGNGLPVPRPRHPSTSPAASSYSSMTSSTSASAEPVTPPSNTPSLWKKIKGWADDKDKEKDKDKDRDREADQTVTSRKKAFAGSRSLLKRSSANFGAAGAVLVRTVSRQKNNGGGGGGSPPNGQST